MARNTIIQQYIIYEICNKIYMYITEECSNVRIHSRQVDELILEIDVKMKSTKLLKDILFEIRELLDDFEVNIQLYRLICHNFETSSGSTFSVYEKKDCHKYREVLGKLKSCPSTYFPQVYKLLMFQAFQDSIEIKPEICEEMDLVFYYEKNLCKFLKPIKKIVNLE